MPGEKNSKEKKLPKYLIDFHIKCMKRKGMINNNKNKVI